MTAPVTRPNPLAEAAAKVGTAWAAAAGVVGALVAYGALTTAQGAALTAAGEALSPTVTALGVVVAGVTPLVGGIVAAFRTAAAGREHVTPMADPRDDAGRPLVVEGEVVAPVRAQHRLGE